MKITENTFAEACYNQNSIPELKQALIDGPDETDMKTWDIDAEEWQQQIKIALIELENDSHDG